MKETNIGINQIKSLYKEGHKNVYGFAELVNFAILLPLIEIDGELSLLFEVRSQNLRRQPGEICFPGGKIDEDDLNEEYAAIRETCEELGLEPNQVEVIGELGVLVPPYQIALHTFVGRILTPQQIRINEAEVEEVFYVPLQFLLQQDPEVHYLKLGMTPGEDFPYEFIPGGRNYNFRQRNIPEYFYFYKDWIIWGLTARILYQFLEQVKGKLNK